MFLILMLGTGLFWSLTYILILRKSFLDHTYGMPIVALCANISWEFIFAFLFPSLGVQRIINIIWFLLDSGIVVSLLLYGSTDFANLTKSLFYMLFSVTLITCFFSVLFITLEFHDHGAYSAFGQNLMMSVLFPLMLYNRRSLRGQSLNIAICKLIGTAFASLAFLLYSPYAGHSVLLPFLYLMTAFYDILYVVLVFRKIRGKNHIVSTHQRLSSSEPMNEVHQL